MLKKMLAIVLSLCLLFSCTFTVMGEGEEVEIDVSTESDAAAFDGWYRDPSVSWGTVTEADGTVTTNLRSNCMFAKLTNLIPGEEYELSFDIVCPDNTYAVALDSKNSCIVDGTFPLESMTSGIYEGTTLFSGGFKKANFVSAGGTVVDFIDSAFNGSYVYNKNVVATVNKEPIKQTVRFKAADTETHYLMLRFLLAVQLTTYEGVPYKKYTIKYEKADGTTGSTSGYSLADNEIEYNGFNTISYNNQPNRYKVYYNGVAYSIGDTITVGNDVGTIFEFAGGNVGNIVLDDIKINSTSEQKTAVALSEGAGVANVSNNGKVYSGETVTYVASELKGGSFLGWYDAEDVQVSTDAVYSVNYTGSEDLTYTAKFSGSPSLSVDADLMDVDNWKINNNSDKIYSSTTFEENGGSITVTDNQLSFDTINQAAGIKLTVKTNTDYKLKFKYKSTAENDNAFGKSGTFNVPFNFFAITKDGANSYQQYATDSTSSRQVPTDPYYAYIYSSASSDEGLYNASYKCTDGDITFLGDNNKLDEDDSDVTLWREVEIPFNVGDVANSEGLTTLWFVLNVNTTNAPMLIGDMELVDYTDYVAHGRPTETVSAEQLENPDYWYSNYYKDTGTMFNEGAEDTTPYWSSVTKETDLPAGGPETALKFTSSALYPFYTLLNVKTNTVYTISYDYYVVDRTAMNDTPFYATFIRPYTEDLTMSAISKNSTWSLAAQSAKVAGYNQDGLKSQSGVFKPTDARNSEVGKWYHFSISFNSEELTQYLLTFVGFNPYYDYTRNSVYVGNFSVTEQVAKTGNALSLRPESGDAQNGIRIKNTISKSLIEEKNIVEYGSVVIFAKNKNSIAELRVDTPKAKLGVAYDEEKGISKIYEDDGSTITFTAVLYNFNTYNLDKELLVRAYAKDSSGNYYYGDVLSFSVYDVLYAIDENPVNDYDTTVSNWFKDYEKTDTSLTGYYQDWYENQYFYEKEEKDPDTYDYSFALVGDTQVLANRWPEKLSNIYDWIVENKESKKIEYSLHMGDISDTVLSTGVYKTEYTETIAQFEKLENADIPYGFVRGNHDLVADYDQYFTAEDYATQITGSYDSTMKNTYRKIEIGGTKYLMLQIDWGLNAKELAWAKGIVESNPDYNVIVTTHAYLKVGGSLLDRNQHYNSTLFTGGKFSADQLFDMFFSQYENIVMVICGHIGCDGVQTTFRTGNNGNRIAEILINPQDIEAAENTAYGLVGMLYFSNGGKTVSVEHYSTVYEKYYGKQNEYTFELDLID